MTAPYHILGLLEAVRPELSLTDYFLYITPADSVKKLVATPHLVKAVTFRPSLLRKVSRPYSVLNKRQKALFEDLLQEKGIETFSDELVLDTAISYLTYQKKEQRAATLHRLLVRRGQLSPKMPSGPSPSPLPLFRANNRPDEGHAPHLLQVSGGVAQRRFFQELSYQTAYHDLLANDRGHASFSEILFPSLTVRHQDSKWFLEEANLVTLTSLNPWTRFKRKLSWSLNLRLLQEKLPFHAHSTSGLKGSFSTGTGFTSFFLGEKSLISMLVFFNVEVGSVLQKGHSVGPRLMALFLTNPLEWYKSKFSYSRFIKIPNLRDLRRRTSTRQIWEWGHSFSLGQNTEFRATFSRIREKNNFNQVKISILFYTM